MEEILHQLICWLSHYLHGFIHPRWLFGISSINTSTGKSTIVDGYLPENHGGFSSAMLGLPEGK